VHTSSLSLSFFIVSTFKVNSYNKRPLRAKESTYTSIACARPLCLATCLYVNLSVFLVVLDETNVFGVFAKALTADHDVVFTDERVLVGAHAAADD